MFLFVFCNRGHDEPNGRSLRPPAASSCAGGDCGLAANYNSSVARGWESKSVEAQQAEAADKAAGSRPRMRPEDAARWREKEKFRLARQSVLQQLQANQNPRYRQLLQDALADLDRKLSQLEQ